MVTPVVAAMMVPTVVAACMASAMTAAVAARSSAAVTGIHASPFRRPPGWLSWASGSSS
ncbi:hypothetical protein ACIPD2_39945 [Streptomyces griseofuscus]|uniref:hypothetical protein n=1 Tax=Streptomyces griseofuscus TaxID=146922 RepID=UPI0037F919AD